MNAEEQISLLPRDNELGFSSSSNQAKQVPSDKNDFVGKEAKATIDTLFFQRFFRLMGMSGFSFFSRPHLYLWQLFFLSALCGQLNLVATLWQGRATALLTLGHYSEFWTILPEGLMLYGGFGLVSALLSFVGQTLSWHWRKNITEKITEKYLSDVIPYCVINRPDYSIDNPDQRIVHDIVDLCDSSTRIIYESLPQFFTLGLLTYSLWKSLGWIPVAVTLGASLIFSVGFKFICSKLAHYTFIQDKFEGNYRYAHARVREYAESISFYKGESMEKSNTEKALCDIVENQRKVAKWQLIFDVYRSSNQYIPEVLAIVVSILALWNTHLSAASASSKLSTSVQQIIQIMAAVAALVKLGVPFAVLAGSVGRVAQLLELCTYLENNKDTYKPKTEVDPNKIVFDNITCDTPQNSTLVFSLSAEIRMKSSVLIMGPSGCGKSSLLRSLAGIWHCDGTISRPSILGRNGIFFLSQKPYFVTGSLRQQVLYPFTENQYTTSSLSPLAKFVLEDFSSDKNSRDSDAEFSGNDAELLKCLKMAKIDYLVPQRGGLDAVCNWAQVLSPGEQQRVAMARLYYHCPKFAILDEATSALDTVTENVLYTNCVKLGITLVSVAHRRTVIEFHDNLLLFDGLGKYTLTKITQQMKKQAREENKKCWKTEISKVGHDTQQKQDVIDDTENKEKLDNLSSPAISERAYIPSLFALWRIIHPHFFSVETLQLFAVIFGAILGSAGAFLVAFFLNPIFQNFLDRNFAGFLKYSIGFIGSLSTVGFVAPIFTGATGFLGVRYRNTLCQLIHNIYFSGGQILRLNTMEKDVDNIDQRIASDTNMATSGFSPNPGIPVILSQFSSAIALPLVGIFGTIMNPYIGFLAVGMISVFIVVCLIISLILTLLLAKYTYLQSKAEGDYRFAQIKIREFSQEIAFYGSAGFFREKISVQKLFEKALEAQWNLILSNSALNVFLTVIEALGPPVCSLITVWCFQINHAPHLPAAELIALLRTSRQYIRNTLSGSIGLLQLFPLFGGSKGYVARIFQLFDRMKFIQEEESRPSYNNFKKNLIRDQDAILSLQDLICTTPTGRNLNEYGISLSVNASDRVLVMGPSGCGKSSLLRVISGLWPVTKGTVTVNPDVLFLPQKPYMVLGTLRDQIIYPKKTSDSGIPSDNVLGNYLREAKLDYLLVRFTLDSTEIWNSVLSPGEQQRLGFARAFFHVPKLLFLDESTSALDPSNEHNMYQSLCSHSQEKISDENSPKNKATQRTTMVSVGHRDSLMNFHNFLLKFDGKGGWELLSEDPQKSVVDLLN